MVDSVLFVFVQLLPYLALMGFILVAVKTYLFIKQKTSSWKAVDYFYFEYSHIQRSNSESAQRRKRFQNKLSIIISIVLVLLLTGILFMNKVNG